MTELVLQAQLLEKLRPALFERDPYSLVFKINDHLTSGIPDIIIDYLGSTSWLELKLADPRIRHGLGLQLYNMKKIARRGRRAVYIIYTTAPETCLVHPADVTADGYFTTFVRTPGWDHDWVVARVREIHEW